MYGFQIYYELLLIQDTTCFHLCVEVGSELRVLLVVSAMTVEDQTGEEIALAEFWISFLVVWKML